VTLSELTLLLLFDEGLPQRIPQQVVDLVLLVSLKSEPILILLSLQLLFLALLVLPVKLRVAR